VDRPRRSLPFPENQSRTIAEPGIPEVRPLAGPIMAEPIWILDDLVVAIHHRQLAEHGGSAGIRSEQLLSSALAPPRNLYAHGTEPDIAALAAAYAFGIVRNRPFVDGNKRTGYVVCRTFLILNGYDLDAPADEKYLTIVKLAEGRHGDDELADWIRRHLRA